MYAQSTTRESGFFNTQKMAVINESSFSPEWQRYSQQVQNYAKSNTAYPAPTPVPVKPAQPQVLGVQAPVNSGGDWRSLPGYSGWDPAAAEADFRATGGAGKGGGGSNQNDLYRQIDEAYGASEGYLNQAESAVRKDYPNALAEAESIYNTNKSVLGNQKADAGVTIENQRTKARQTKESALAEARRMYQEQQIGANQRFGGSSSAGQAFSELQAREQARNFGLTQRQFADTQTTLDQQSAKIDRDYNTSLLQLDQQKQTLTAQATKDFEGKLLQIAQSRAMIGQAKAEAKLNALMDYRNQIMSINMQNQQFEQQVALMREQARLQLTNFGESAQSALSNAISAASNYNPQSQLTSGYGATDGSGTQSQSPSLVGQINPNKRFEDLLGFNPFA